MAKHALHFTSQTYTRHDGSEYTPRLNDDMRIRLIIEELNAIYQREKKGPLGHNDLPYCSDEYLLEAISYLEKAIEWPGDIEDSYGEPPMTMDEMHTSAWKEHMAMHS